MSIVLILNKLLYCIGENSLGPMSAQYGLLHKKGFGRKNYGSRRMETLWRGRTV